MIASVTLPLPASIVMTQTPLPVILARFAWYGYSGNGALTAMAWAAGNDNEVTTGELGASARAAEVGDFFPRAFFLAAQLMSPVLLEVACARSHTLAFDSMTWLQFLSSIPPFSSSVSASALPRRYPRVPEDLPKWRPAHVQAVH